MAIPIYIAAYRLRRLRPTYLGTMADSILQRLEAARLVLNGAKNTPSYSSIAKLQAAALCSMIKTSESIEAEEGMTMSTKIQGLRMPSADEAMLLSALAEKVARKRATVRRSMQDYSSLAPYFTDKETQTLQKTRGHVTPQAAMHIFFSRATALGCRNPNEPTKQSWASQVGVCCELQMDVVHPLLVDSWGRFRRRLPSPDTWLEVLPPSPSTLKEEQPALYAAAYPDGTEPAGKAVADEVQAAASCLGHSMRGRKRGVPAAAIVPWQPAPSQQAHAQQPRTDVADMMLMCKSMFEMFTSAHGRGGSSGSDGREDVNPLPPPGKYRRPGELDIKIFGKDNRAEAAGVDGDVQPQPALEDIKPPDMGEGGEAVGDGLAGELDLMAALASRDAQRAREAKKRKEAAAEGAPVPKAAAKKAAAKPKGRPKAAAKKPAAAPAAVSGEKRANGKPHFSIEWSRNQVLCRTGVMGEKSVAFKFGPGLRTCEEARGLAVKWCSDVKRKRKL